LVCLFAGSALAEGWIVDSSNGCGTSNPFPKPNESISWKGGCRDGKLDGPGTLIWYRNNIETERDQGNFRGGELDGEAVISYPDGHAIIGAYRDGQRHGEFIVTKPNGQVTISQYEEGRFISEKQLSASEATARAPEIAARRRQFGDTPRTIANAPSMPARARATPEPVVAAPIVSAAPAPPPPLSAPPPLPAPLPATPPVAAARSVAPIPPPPATPTSAYAPGPTYAPSPTFAPSAAAPVGSQAPITQLIPPPGVGPAPAAPPPLLAQNAPLPPSRARVAAQPPSTAPSAILAEDLRAAMPRDDGRIVLRPPKPRGSQSPLPALAVPDAAPPPNRSRAAYSAPRAVGYDEPIVLRPPKRQPAAAVPRQGGRQVAASVWVDDAALPPANPVYAGQAPVLRPPGTRQGHRATRQQPSADLAPVHLTPPPRLGQAPISVTPPPISSGAPILQPPPLTPAVSPSPLSPPPLAPPQPGAPPRPGSPSARAEPAARYALSLTDADLPQAARAILGGALGEPYAIDPGLAGNVTLTPAAALDRDQLLSEFRRALLVQGVDLRRDGGGWRLTAWQDASGAGPARVAARNDIPVAPSMAVTPASDAESRFVAGFGLERSGRQVEAMQAYNGLIATYPDTPSAALARERLNLLAQAAPRAPMAAAAPAVPAPGARPTANARAGQYLCTVPGLFGGGSLWCGHVTGEDTERYELVIRRVSVAGLLNIGFSKAPCTGETFISQLSVGQKVVVPKGCMAP